MTIDEGNELIARFLGYSRKIVKYEEKVYNSSNEYYYDWTEGELWVDNQGYPVDDELDELKFHSSWDWLMPVVEKIENMKIVHTVSIINNYCGIYISKSKSIDIVFESSEIINDNNVIFRKSKNSKIEAVWDACIKFIQWYNTQ